MEIAMLVLEYVKALAWPLVVVFLVLRFRLSILQILDAVGSRLASAETVKVGVLGQEVEISGIAKELKMAGQELLAASGGDEYAQQKADQLLSAVPELNNPIADIVGVALLDAQNEGLTTDSLIEAVLDSFNPRREEAPLKSKQAEFILVSMAREVEKVLAKLQDIEFATVDHDRHSLTSTGIEFFRKVAARQKSLLARFSDR